MTTRGFVSAGVFTLASFVLLALTRLPLAPHYLYHFDSVNFALALDDFNPAKHQPQPPGYPLFVALMRVIHLLIPNAEGVLLAAGLLMATAALVLVWRLTTEMFNAQAGILAAALLLLNPAFWFGGITNQVRLSLAFCSAGIAWLAWQALKRPDDRFRLYTTFTALGLAAGFRPTLGVLLIPLLLWVWWRNGANPKALLVSGAFTASAALPWIAPTVLAVGGTREWLSLMWSYSNDQFRGSSVVFGAPVPSAWKMAAQAVIWNGLGVLTWFWAIRSPQSSARSFDVRALFLCIWFLPIVLFSALIHIGDPDQALASIPVLCIAGGAVLAAFAKGRNVGLTSFATGVAALNAVLFFYPPGRIAKASGYGAVRSVDLRTRALFRSIEELKIDSAVAIVHYRGLVTWRQLSYYFPEDYVVYLAPEATDASWTLFGRKAVNHSQAPDALPGPRRVILIAPDAEPAEMKEKGWSRYGLAYYRDLDPGMRVEIGPYQLVQRSST